ncbi:MULTISPECIES: acyl carrier protein [Streptomyces]|uniref:Acyl carrier protein n=1 Tax=Streptomyces rhizosphaericus TaxID=114699 RepID=A0A6G4ADV8_9ACTN|nr:MULTISPECIES: acyl carrier protein [Streptomyces]MBA6433881.1 acyl carrier protein [Streptomyces sp. GMR22]MBI0382066.1 acyl carrier protein [Streptomyces albiflaviniger]NEW71400.1 acyl carrier protein [Streptomyces rhizosphaericus]
MTTFTLDDLVLIMRAGGGADREELEGDILDMPFGDLGYDSLALLEVTTRIENQYGISLPEDIAVPTRTPREAIEQINSVVHAD